MGTDWGLINERSVVRADLDSDRRDIIPCSIPPYTSPVYMDAIQLRVSDLEFLIRLDWRTPHNDKDGTPLELHSYTDVWEEKWYKKETIPKILRKVYDLV